MAELIDDDTPMAPGLQRAAQAAAAVIGVLGAAALVGWATNIDVLKRVIPGAVAMNPLTAVCFLTSALVLWKARVGHPRRRLSILQWLAVAVPILVGGVKMIDTVTPGDLTFDLLLFPDALKHENVVPVNRMAPNTALNFFLCGAALLLIHRPGRGWRKLGQALAMLAGLLSMVAIIGYLYQTRTFYGVGSFIPMALNTAIGFSLLAVGILFMTADEGVMRVVASDSAGGILARRLLPPLLLVPMLLGWIRLHWQDLVDPEFAGAVHAVINTALFGGLTWWTAWMLYSVDGERRAAVRKLREAKEVAEAASSSKSAFLANMSHEIRTPMTAIIGYADLMLDPDQGPSERLNAVHTIRRNGDHLLAIINDILDLSKIEAGKMLIERVECSPCHIVADVSSMMRVRAAERGLRFEVEQATRVPLAIRSDPTRIRQVLVNLIGNAIKFTERGEVRLCLRLLDPDSPAPRLRFSVTDTGVGIPSERIADIFEPFTQADESTTRRFGGTGLGLTICRRIADMLTGDISVVSRPNQGTTFHFTIPTGDLTGVKLLQNCSEALIPDDTAKAPTRGARLSGRVLLVEDGIDNRRLIQAYLERSGLTVSTADNGRVALQAATDALERNQPFHVILMDIQMPEMDGYTATAKLRTRGYAAPIVALTAHAMAEDRQRCLAAGFDDYLSKPVRPDELIAIVARRLPAEAAPPAEALRSSGDDPLVHEFVGDYIGSFPQRVERLLRAVDGHDAQDLAAAAHDLKGSGGFYGFPVITEQAGRLQQLLIDNAPWEQSAAMAQRLIDLLRSAEGYDGSLERYPRSPAG